MNESGLSAIFLAQREELVRLLAARLGSREEAEDVVQEMWFRLDRGPPSGPIANPRAYLFRMAANLATDRRVSATRRAAREDEWTSLQASGAEYPDGERHVAARQELGRVERILDDMPVRMRQALILFRLEEMPQRTIAEQLGITVSGVEKLLKRGYQRLTEALSDPCADHATQHRQHDEGSAPDA